MSTRDVAGLILLTAAAIWILSTRTGRSAIRGILHALSSKLLVILCAFLGYALLVLLAAWHVGLWNYGLLSETVLWFALSGFLLFGRFDRVGNDPHFARTTLAQIVSLGVVGEFILNIVTFNLLVELALAIVAIFFTLLLAVATLNEEHRAVARFAQGTLAALGVGVILGTSYSLYRQWDDLDYLNLGLTLGMLLWFPLALLPAVYALGLLSSYEQLFNWLSFFRVANSERFARLAILTTFRWNAFLVSNFSNAWRWELRQQPDFPSALTVTRRYRRAYTKPLAHHIRRETHRLQREVAGTNRTKSPAPPDAFEMEYIASRAPGWEYRLYADSMIHLLGQARVWKDLRSRGLPFTSTPHTSRRFAVKRIQRSLRLATKAVAEIEDALGSRRQEAAFGRPGYPGDENKIIKMAARLVLVYGTLDDLQWRLNLLRLPKGARRCRDAAVAILEEPNGQIETFISEFKGNMIALEEPDSGGTPINIQMTLTAHISEKVLSEYREAMSLGCK